MDRLSLPRVVEPSHKLSLVLRPGGDSPTAERLYAKRCFPCSLMALVAVTPILPHDVLCAMMEFLDIRTLKAASLVNRDFKYGADRLIWQSFYICVHADVEDAGSCDEELRRIEEGCRIVCAGIRPKRIRKFTLTFSEFNGFGYDWEDDYPGAEFERSILEMVFARLRVLTGLRQLELDLANASWDGHIDDRMSNLFRESFPFQLERFALTKPSYDDMDFLPKILVSQQSITSLFLNWPSSMPTGGLSPRLPARRVLDPGQWHVLKDRPITHLFAGLMDGEEVLDLFGSLSRSTATLQLLWFKTPSWRTSEAFFDVAADRIAATVVSTLRYLVLETIGWKTAN
ncbi:hypothetical protein BS47DRAFT_77061 [Hydnum rufescens UP504]|uniref:F-box domain-containing protein n=1 Tax=Hydnum rufescens UP504 TaxID=1448309 RepID=A0A9P6B8E8_9AGAM|nr:hypothetical protein BS47DRAFT_77061 [Hydnum rufescens UP504]